MAYCGAKVVLLAAQISFKELKIIYIHSAEKFDMIVNKKWTVVEDGNVLWEREMNTRELCVIGLLMMTQPVVVYVIRHRLHI